MLGTSTEIDVDALLDQWGQWVRSGRPGPGRYRCPLGSLRGGGLPVAPISDDQALRVDSAVALLKRLRPALAHALEVYYGMPYQVRSYVKLAKALRIAGARGRETAKAQVDTGTAWIEGFLLDRVAA